MKGVYQHSSKKYLHRYTVEFGFRYNFRAANGIDDVARAKSLLKGIVGRRVTYRDSSLAMVQYTRYRG